MAKRLEEKKRELASTLLKAGRNYREVAEALDMSIGSVHKVSREPREDLAPLVEELRRRFSAKCLLLADHLLSRITDTTVGNASLKDRVIAAAILADKAERAMKSSDGGPPPREHVNTPETPEPLEKKGENGR